MARAEGEAGQGIGSTGRGQPETPKRSSRLGPAWLFSLGTGCPILSVTAFFPVLHANVHTPTHLPGLV